jgi:1,5-anhydro-D-fructose reductase (1,5-anhydro-D-mannitol-forming)
MAARIGWALVGASTIADEWMVDAIRAQADATIETVVSGNAARAQEFAAKHDIARHSTDLDAVLADPAVHAVYISSTNEKHLPQVLAAARAGKHVLCEKPLALSEADAARMIEACAEHGVVLGTNHHLRNASTHRKLRELIIDGAIGTPLFARVFHAVSLPPHLRGWRIEKQDAGGGVVLDITVHDVDTLRFVLNAEPIEVSAMTTTGTMSNAGLTDGVMAIVRFDNGVLAQLHDAFTVPFAATGLEVHGSEGSLIAKDVMTQRAVGEIELRDANGVRSIEVEHANLYHTGVAQFHRAIREGQRPAASGVDGYRSLITALAVAQAAQAGGHVDVSRRYAE